MHGSHRKSPTRFLLAVIEVLFSRAVKLSPPMSDLSPVLLEILEIALYSQWGITSAELNLTFIVLS